MTRIVTKRRLSEEVYRVEVEAPLVARERLHYFWPACVIIKRGGVRL